MNKYQEALDGLVNVKENFVYHEGKMIQIKNIKNAKLLQELVDKATPKKPIKLDYKLLLDEGWRYECPICKCAIGINTNAFDYTQEEGYCPTCGQALDWSTNED